MVLTYFEKHANRLYIRYIKNTKIMRTIQARECEIFNKIHKILATMFGRKHKNM